MTEVPMPLAAHPRAVAEVRDIRGGGAATIALAGRAQRGPVNQATAIWRFADFERIFGGLWAESRLGFEVRDFFHHGGAQAIVVRLFHVTGNSHAALDANGLILRALTPGSWGNSLRARIDHNIVPSDPNRFNLTVRHCGTGKLEIFRNLSWQAGDRRRVDAVVAAESHLVSAALPAARPRAHANLAPAATPPRVALWADNTPATSARAGVLADDGGPLEVTDFTGPIEFDGEKGRYILRDPDFFRLLRT
jgi:hypothetical protein